MTKMFSRAGRAATLDRRPFTEAFFDGDAAADAAILVSVAASGSYLLFLIRSGALSRFSIPTLLQAVIGGVVSWIILAFGTWFAATRLFNGSGRPQTMMALQGLAVLPLLLDGFGSAASTLGLIWYLAILVVATREAASVNMRNAAVSVLIGFAVSVIFRALLGVPYAIFSAIF